MRPTRLATLAGALAAGLVVGLLVGEERMSGRAHVAGACIALELVSDTSPEAADRRARIIKALVTQENPLRAAFPLDRDRLTRQCAHISGLYRGHSTGWRRDIGQVVSR